MSLVEITEDMLNLSIQEDEPINLKAKKEGISFKELVKKLKYE